MTDPNDVYKWAAKEAGRVAWEADGTDHPFVVDPIQRALVAAKFDAYREAATLVLMMAECYRSEGGVSENPYVNVNDVARAIRNLIVSEDSPTASINNPKG